MNKNKIFTKIRKHVLCVITKNNLQTNLYTCATVNILLVELLSAKMKFETICKHVGPQKYLTVILYLLSPIGGCIKWGVVIDKE